MPVLGDSQGHLIPKSIITCEYLDEEHQEKLFTDDPYGKVWMTFFGKKDDLREIL